MVKIIKNYESINKKISKIRNNYKEVLARVTSNLSWKFYFNYLSMHFEFSSRCIYK